MIVPRVVLVTRPTEYEELIDRHATVGQARFFVESRGQSFDAVTERHDRFAAAQQLVSVAIPRDWRRAHVQRGDLDRFLFSDDDLIVVLGQDGLVANVSKYLTRQTVIGLNPDPSRYDGILVPYPPGALGDLLGTVASGRAHHEQRTMVQARLDDGQRIVAINEIYVGHRTHQSSKYRIAYRGASERHSSSGLIVATGTGATGWARSINRSRAHRLELPAPTDGLLAFFVREAFPSVATGTELTEGLLDDAETLDITSRMDDGVIFGDGIEDDRLRFEWGRTLAVGVADCRLNLLQV